MILYPIHMTYFIHGHPVGSDHTPIQLEICMGPENIRKLAFKWNVPHFRGEMAEKLCHMWATLPLEAPFFAKLRKVSRFY